MLSISSWPQCVIVSLCLQVNVPYIPQRHQRLSNARGLLGIKVHIHNDNCKENRVSRLLMQYFPWCQRFRFLFRHVAVVSVIFAVLHIYNLSTYISISSLESMLWTEDIDNLLSAQMFNWKMHNVLSCDINRFLWVFFLITCWRNFVSVLFISDHGIPTRNSCLWNFSILALKQVINIQCIKCHLSSIKAENWKLVSIEVIWFETVTMWNGKCSNKVVLNTD